MWVVSNFLQLTNDALDEHMVTGYWNWPDNLHLNWIFQISFSIWRNKRKQNTKIFRRFICLIFVSFWYWFKNRHSNKQTNKTGIGCVECSKTKRVFEHDLNPINRPEGPKKFKIFSNVAVPSKPKLIVYISRSKEIFWTWPQPQQ